MTAQVDEKLIIDGEETSMIEFPNIPDFHSQIIKISEEEAQNEQEEDDYLFSTACWRNYIGTWEIENNKLYLKEIIGIYKIRGGQRIFADWFSGKIIIPKGDYLPHTFPFDIVYEEEIQVLIEEGSVVKRTIIDNRKNLELRYKFFRWTTINNIKLEERTHQYSLFLEPKLKLDSCTTFIEYFFHKFDSIGIARNLALNSPKYFGKDPKEIVDSWEKIAWRELKYIRKYKIILIEILCQSKKKADMLLSG